MHWARFWETWVFLAAPHTLLLAASPPLIKPAPGLVRKVDKKSAQYKSFPGTAIPTA